MSNVIDSNEGGTDQVGWLDPNGSVSSVKSAYELAEGNSEVGKWEGWKLIWHLKVQQCIKIFIWMLAHERILTNYYRWRRKHAQNPNCGRYSRNVEDTMHVIKDCKFLKDV